MSKNTAPTHFVYSTKEDRDGKSYNTKIGVGWAHQKGGGMNLQLECLPLDGRLVIFTREDKVEREGEMTD